MIIQKPRLLKKFLLLVSGIIFALLLMVSIFILNRLIIHRKGHTPMEPGIISKLKGQIVFNSNRSGADQIYVINANGKGLKQLTNGNGENSSPSWSPDGEQIAFVSTRDGNKEIYLMDREGKKHKRLTFDTANDTEPVWMPDGKHILFVSDRSSVPSFYSVDANGQDLKMIIQFTRGEYGHPVVSNKGDKILYISNEVIGWQIYSYDLLSKRAERLTNPPSGNCDPDISNDGNRILYASRLGMGNSEIWIMNSNGNDKKLLISHPALEYNPKFSPDDKYVVFNSNRSGTWNLYILEVDSGSIGQLTNDKSDNDRPDWL